MIRLTALLTSVFAVYMPSCVPPRVQPTMPVGTVNISELWEEPRDLSSRDAFNGPWGAANAPLASLICPADRKNVIGRPSPSQTVCNLLFRPPLVRPMALLRGLPPFGALSSGCCRS